MKTTPSISFYNSERHESGSSSCSPINVELAEEYISTSSAKHTMAKNSTNSKVCANPEDSMKQNLSRKDLNKLILRDMEAEAAKRRKISPQDTPNPPSKNSDHGQEVHQSTRTMEFKDFGSSIPARRHEHKALERLLSGGVKNKEDNGGRLLLHTGGRTSECMPASTK